MLVLQTNQQILNAFMALRITPLPDHHADLPNDDSYRGDRENDISNNTGPRRIVQD